MIPKQRAQHRMARNRVFSMIIGIQMVFSSTAAVAASQDPTQPDNLRLMPSARPSTGLVANKVDAMNSLWTVIANNDTIQAGAPQTSVILRNTASGATIQMSLSTGVYTATPPVNVVIDGATASVSRGGSIADGTIQTSNNLVSLSATATTVSGGNDLVNRVTYDISLTKEEDKLAIQKMTITSNVDDKPAWSKEEYVYDAKQRLTDAIVKTSGKDSPEPTDVDEQETTTHIDYDGESDDPKVITVRRVSIKFEDRNNRLGRRTETVEESREYRRYADGLSRMIGRLIVNSILTIRVTDGLDAQRGVSALGSFDVMYQLLDKAARTKISGTMSVSNDELTDDMRRWFGSLNSVDAIKDVRESSQLDTETLSFYGSSELKDEQLRRSVQYVRGEDGMMPQSIEYGPRTGGDPSAIYLVSAGQTSEEALSDPTLHTPIQKSSFITLGGEKHAYRFYQQYNQATKKMDSMLEIEVGYDPISKRVATVKVSYPTVRRVVIREKPYDIFSDVKGEIVLVPLGAAA